MIDRTCHGARDVLARLVAGVLPHRAIRFAGIRLCDYAGRDADISLAEALRRWDAPEIPGTTIIFDGDTDSTESPWVHSICATEQGEIEIQLDDDSYLRLDRKRLLRAVRRAKP